MGIHFCGIDEGRKTTWLRDKADWGELFRGMEMEREHTTAYCVCELGTHAHALGQPTALAGDNARRTSNKIR